MITVVAKLEFENECDCDAWFDYTADNSLSCKVLECD